LKSKVKGKKCVYCLTVQAEEPDHVFAREFFLPEHRDNLPWAPACGKCNRDKSYLEDYLVSVLAFGGRHEQAREYLMTTVVRRLPNNKRLGREILSSMRPAFSREPSGLFLPTVTIDFDGAKIQSFLMMVARGLAWFHWKTYIGSGFQARALIMTDLRAMAFESLVLQGHNGIRAGRDIGNGAVIYEGLQAPTLPQLTVWKISMYGGVALSGGKSRDGSPIETGSRWIVITAPPETLALLDR
jgi:hypothetical protein